MEEDEEFGDHLMACLEYSKVNDDTDIGIGVLAWKDCLATWRLGGAAAHEHLHRAATQSRDSLPPPRSRASLPYPRQHSRE